MFIYTKLHPFTFYRQRWRQGHKYQGQGQGSDHQKYDQGHKMTVSEQVVSK